MRPTLTLSRRRQFLGAAAATLGATALPRHVAAQAGYPSQAVKLIVPYPAGGATDTLGRTLAQKLQEAWGQSVMVENRAGAAGTIGNNAVAKAGPDGYTVLIAITALIQQPGMMDKLPYDPLKDFAPVAMIARSPSMLAVPLSSPAKTLKDFVAMVKAQPGKHTIGNYGIGTSAHIQSALLNQQAGLDLVYVPFQGAAQLVTNLIGGQISSAFVDSASARAQLSQIRPLAVTGTARMPGLPEIPSFQELGYQSFDPYGWFGVFLPAATPPALVQKLADDVNRILRLPDVTARIEGLGLQVGGGTPEEFRKVMRAEAALYARIAKEANIRLAL
jgi:tripartite-type tricarboxylate transporter receptor subunit TctC